MGTDPVRKTTQIINTKCTKKEKKEDLQYIVLHDHYAF